MSIQMQIDLDIKSVKTFLTDFKKKALVNATRKSMNRSASALQTFTQRKIRERRKLKAGEIKRDYLKLKKARGSNLAKLESSVAISGKPVSLIRFVIGSKQPREQAGIPIARRRKLRVEVKPGRKVRLVSAFIAEGRGGKNQVFRRRTKKSVPIVKQSVKALSEIFKSTALRRATEAFAGQKFTSEFERTFEFELQKLIEKGRRR